MSRTRWRPQGQGFRVAFDDGSAALWLRREGTILTGVLYLNWGDAGRDGIWTFDCALDAPILHEIYDKPRRVDFLNGKNTAYWQGTLISRVPVPGGPPRRGPKVRRRYKTNRRVNHKWLDRKFAR